MPISVADLKAWLLAGCRTQAVVALADPTTLIAPSDAALDAWIAWPIYEAVLRCGGSVASPATPLDADLATVADASPQRLMAAALVASKRKIRGMLALVDLTHGTDKQAFSDLARQLDREINDLESDYNARFGATPTGTPRVGRMTSARDPGAGGLQPWRFNPIVPQWRLP